VPGGFVLNFRKLVQLPENLVWAWRKVQRLSHEFDTIVALLDPVAVKAHFVEQRRRGTPQIVHCERRERQIVILGELCDRGGYPIEHNPAHGFVSVVPRREEIARVSGAGFQRDQDVDYLVREIDVVRPRLLHTLFGNAPDSLLEIELVPRCLKELGFSYHRQENQF
jgi:hypothetical protein